MTQPLTQRVEGDSASERLQALGLKLPVLAGTTYLVPHGTAGSTIHLSGQLPENGRHARTAIGVAGLPLNTPVEIQVVCTAV